MKRQICSFRSPSILVHGFDSSAWVSGRCDALGRRNVSSSIVTTVDSQLQASTDGLRTLRRRRNGGRPLPIPPLMDARVEARTRKWKMTKPDFEKHPLTSLRQEILDNPYAQALTTPLRKDVLADTPAPKHFLQSWQTVFRPITNKQGPSKRRLAVDNSAGQASAPAATAADPPAAGDSSPLDTAADASNTASDGSIDRLKDPVAPTMVVQLQQTELKPRIVPALRSHPRHLAARYAWTVLSDEIPARLNERNAYMSLLPQEFPERFGKARRSWKFNAAESEAMMASGLLDDVLSGCRVAVKKGVVRWLDGHTAPHGGGERAAGVGTPKALLMVLDRASAPGGMGSGDDATPALRQEAAAVTGYNIDLDFVFKMPMLLEDKDVAEVRGALAPRASGSGDGKGEAATTLTAEPQRGGAAVVVPIQAATMHLVKALMRLDMYRQKPEQQVLGNGYQ